MSVLSSPGKAVELGTTGTWDRHCTRTEHPTPLGDTIDLAGAKFGAFIFVEISVFAGEREWNEPSDGEQLPPPRTLAPTPRLPERWAPNDGRPPSSPTTLSVRVAGGSRSGRAMDTTRFRHPSTVSSSDSKDRTDSVPT